MNALVIVNRLLEAEEDDFSAFDYAASTLTPTFDFSAGSDLDLGEPDAPPDAYAMRQYSLVHWKGRKHVMLFVYGDMNKEGWFRLLVMVGDSPDRYASYEQNARGLAQTNKRVRQLDMLFSRGQWNDAAREQFNQLGPWHTVREQVQFDREGNPVTA